MVTTPLVKEFPTELSNDDIEGRLSSVVEHRFGKADVESPILSDGTGEAK